VERVKQKLGARGIGQLGKRNKSSSQGLEECGLDDADEVRAVVEIQNRYSGCFWTSL
jgi:hypothetical protein